MAPPPASAALPASFAADGLGASAMLVDELLLGRQRRHAFLAVLAAALCIGFSAIFVRLSDVGPAAIGFWRLLFSLGPMAIWAYAEQRAALVQRGVPVRGLLSRALIAGVSTRQLAYTVVAGAFFAADVICFHAALLRTTTANALLLGNLSVVFVFIFGWLLLGERPTRGLVVAMSLALPGAALIVGASTGVHRAPTHDMTPGASVLGDFLALGAAAFYGAYLLVLRALRRGGEGHAPALGGGTVALLSSAAGAVFCLVWAVVTGEVLVPQSVQGLLAVMGLGLVAHAAGQGLATFALGRLPAGVISVGLLLQIVVGTSFAALLFDEVPSGGVLAGGALVVAGVVALRRPRRASAS
ncbi:DMT family transporter [Ancylobacter pratisalsi]|uniref:DMT family transporter n=1 Tax=Ancylobacter pratisalsi TaxID=1745854 RepID=A0A6P1YI39_9HYPH|nr:DMT family transporter [Ancylobacter pratisalsi]QIB32998.1 DMT family transporter [Ancylobacter pratisalsi]